MAVLITIMNTVVLTKLNNISHRPRVQIGASRADTASTTVRVEYIKATMKTMRIVKVSEMSTFARVRRSYIPMSNVSPFKGICVGIKPYKNKIPPNFASPLLYSLGSYSAVTPSGQVQA